LANFPHTNHDYFVSVMARSHCRRGRDKTVLSRRFGGVNKPLEIACRLLIVSFIFQVIYFSTISLLIIVQSNLT